MIIVTIFITPTKIKSMKNILLVISVFSYLSLFGQIETEIGIGSSYSLQFFQHEGANRFENEFFKPDIGYSLGMNGYFEIKTKNKFQFRSNLLLGQKNCTVQ